MSLSIMVCGTKHFGSECIKAINALDCASVDFVSTPHGDRCEYSALLAGAEVLRGAREADIPCGVDLIVAAHSHDFISEKARFRARLGAIGYHPSLLPLHRGRDSVKWAVRMGDRVTGGTIYRLSNRVDGGGIILQRHAFIRPDDTAGSLWRRELCPMGVDMVREAVLLIAGEGYIAGDEQDEEIATWEPSIGRQPLHRPDLLMLPAPVMEP